MENASCIICGSTKNVLRHHRSYDPEEIEPLCKSCHTKLHKLYYVPSSPIDAKSKGQLRPQIELDLVRKVKMKFPKETGMLGIAETVEWALKELIKIKEA